MLMGDFNVDFLNPMDTNYSHLQSMCIVHGLSNRVQSPTRFSPTSSRCIDLILGNFPKLSQATVDHVDFTDHALISSSLNTTVEKKHQAMETTRRTWPSRKKLSSATSDFQHVLQFYMQTLPTGVDVDNMWEELMETKIQYCSWWSRPKSNQSSQPQASPLSLDDQRTSQSHT